MAEGKLQKVNLCKNLCDEKGVTDRRASRSPTCSRAWASKPRSIPARPGMNWWRQLRLLADRLQENGPIRLRRVLPRLRRGARRAPRGDAQAHPPRRQGAPALPGPERPALGLIPVSATETNPRARLSELRQALSKSVEDEDYEEAAVCAMRSRGWKLSSATPETRPMPPLFSSLSETSQTTGTSGAYPPYRSRGDALFHPAEETGRMDADSGPGERHRHDEPGPPRAKSRGFPFPRLAKKEDRTVSWSGSGPPRGTRGNERLLFRGNDPAHRDRETGPRRTPPHQP